MANLPLAVLTNIAKYIKGNFVKKTSQTEAVQEQFLCRLLQAQQNTELSWKYKLSEIKIIDQFRAQIPILSDSNYEPFIGRIAQREKNILTADAVVHLTLTSGTTRKKKLIPTTRRSQNSFR